MCRPKTMLKIGAVIVAALAAAWFALPSARTLLVVIAPFVLFAICPLAMVLGMYGMHAMGRGETKQHSDCCASHSGPNTGKEKEQVK